MNKNIGLIVFVMILLTSSCSVLAVGRNSSNSVNIPLPVENYVAQVTDNRNVTTKASRISWNGKIYLQGKRGASLVTIPFSRIKEIRFGKGITDFKQNIKAQVILKNNESIDMTLQGSIKVYGATSYGKFELYMSELRSIVFE